MKSLYFIRAISCLLIIASNTILQTKDHQSASSLIQAQQLFTRDIVKLMRFIHEKGYEITFGEAMRSREQALLYALRGIGIVQSLHCQRLAIDFNLFHGNTYLSQSQDHKPFGVFWESLSPCNRWGGNFAKPDGNHYERNPHCIE